MDLQGENRILVREGLKRLRRTGNPGLRELILQNQLEMEQVDVYHIGFILGPLPECQRPAGHRRPGPGNAAYRQPGKKRPVWPGI